MNKNEFEKGTKRKCASCETLFYDFNKNPLICPKCGSEVNMLTNISKRGRPPKVVKVEAQVVKEKNELEIEDLTVEDEVIVPNDDIEDSIGDGESENVENIIEIGREEDT